MQALVRSLKPGTGPILIAGPTASGKSTLAMRLAQELTGCIINADALQVYAGWRILTARPEREDEALVPHHLYGQVAMNTAYSVGHWLKDVSVVLKTAKKDGIRPIIVGGTGLYFTALTEGLADIPTIPLEIRGQGDVMRQAAGSTDFAKILRDQDPETFAKIDINNPVRLQRAWEVLTATGRGMTAWQTETQPPIININEAYPLILTSNNRWLNTRITNRFEQMVEQGAVQECQVNLDLGWNVANPSSRALGAAEIMDYLRGEITLEMAVEQAIVKTRQYAKRQRSWFRNRMNGWGQIDVSDVGYSLM